MALTRTIRRRLPGLLLVPVLGLGGVHAEPPDSPQARAQVLWREGAALHVEQDYKAAVEHFREALVLHPTARTHTWLAWSLSRMGETRKAVLHCRRSIELDPDYPNAYNDLGSYLVDLERPREAEQWLRRALDFDDYCCPHYAWYHLGRSLLLQGRLDAAMSALETSLQHRSNYRPPLRLLILLRMLDLQVA